jgi:hypothetical protein
MPGSRAILEPLIRLVLNAAIPVLVYLLLRPHLRSDLTALIIAAAIPIGYTAAVLVWRRRLDPVGVIAIGCFAVGLLLVVATGGSELMFKLREDIWTGPLGLACLISAAIHRPLLLYALQLVARRNAQVAERIRQPGARRITTVSTAVIGLLLVVHAVVLVVLAVSTSTSTFLAVSRPVSWLITGGGLAGLVVWIRRERGPGPAGPAGPSARS